MIHILEYIILWFVIGSIVSGIIRHRDELEGCRWEDQDMHLGFITAVTILLWPIGLLGVLSALTYNTLSHQHNKRLEIQKEARAKIEDAENLLKELQDPDL